VPRAASARIIADMAQHVTSYRDLLKRKWLAS
jgi:hypothetical protein